MAVLGGAITLSLLIFFLLFNRTHIVRIMKGIRDDHLAILSYGKSPVKYKAIALLISGGTAAIAGGLYATYTSYIDPGSFNLDESILIVSIVLIGGLGSVKGSVAGAVFYVLLPEILRYVNIPYAIAANIRMMIYAAVLILTVIFRPYGFFGKYKFERRL
jgi:branched-chain amino acid transport system permease protein